MARWLGGGTAWLIVAFVVCLIWVQSQHADAFAQQVESVPLPRGCSNVALTWPIGTSVSDIAEAISPSDALESLFRLDAGQGRFIGFSIDAPSFANDYTTVTTSLEPVFVCVDRAATLNRPAVSSNTASPSPTSSPSSSPPPSPSAAQPVMLSGRGQTATQPVTPPADVSVVTLSHSGRSNFIVKVFRDGDEELLVNEIGSYSGSRPLFGSSPATFDIRADGDWSILITPVTVSGTPEFTGRGDSVSGLFDTVPTGAFEFSHDGRSNFIVWLHCAGGSVLVQNEIGRVQGSRIVPSRMGPCLWEVEADGNWSIRPRQ
jgi:hypothetical protein